MHEAMGLVDMIEVGRKPMEMPSAAGIKKTQGFNELWATKGIKGALAMRDATSDPAFTQV